MLKVLAMALLIAAPDKGCECKNPRHHHFHKPEPAPARLITVDYRRDDRTDLCFAEVRNSDVPYNPSWTNVPCSDAVKALLP